ncbi:hypothetical protein BDR26DRAFT_871885, partial [Obelidium mucronatum]
MSTTNMQVQCASYFTYDSAVDTDCASASAFATAILCKPVASCISVAQETCKATAQTGTFTSSFCTSISLDASSALSLPASTVTNFANLFSAASVAAYAPDTCQGQPTAGGLFALGQCSPSPYNDGTWGIVNADLANNLYYDGYSDSNCDTYVDTKVLSKPGSTCVNKVSAKVLKSGGARTVFFYSDTCTTVSRMIQSTLYGACSTQTSCSQSRPSMVSRKTVSCQASNPLEYNIEDVAKTTFGSKPYALINGYSDKACQTAAPTYRSAVVLDSCYASTSNGSTIYTQAANGSLVYSHYSDLKCAGVLQDRQSYSGACDAYAKISLVNVKNPLATGVVASTTKTSNGISSTFAFASGILLVAGIWL